MERQHQQVADEDACDVREVPTISGGRWIPTGPGPEVVVAISHTTASRVSAASMLPASHPRRIGHGWRFQSDSAARVDRIP